MENRIKGLDLARTFSIFGMMVVNYHFAFGAFQGNSLLQEAANFFSGRASATFVILAGMGLILFSRKMRENPEDILLKNKTKRILLNRSLFLFIIGTLDSIYWPADILRSYGAFFLIGSLSLNWKKYQYLIASLLSILIFTVLFILFDFSKDWDTLTFSYNGFWTPTGFLKSLFFNGWNPLFPWIGFFFYGMFLGTHLCEEKNSKKLIGLVSILVFLILFSCSLISEIREIINPSFMKTLYTQKSIFIVNQLPPLPLYYFLSISFANLVILFFWKIGDMCQNSKLVQFLSRVGMYSHTIYLFHIYIGIIIYLIIRNIPSEEAFYSSYGTESIEFMWIFTLAAFMFSSIFCFLWSKFYSAGPLELLVKKLTESKHTY